MAVYGVKKIFRLSEDDAELLKKKSEEAGVTQSAYLRIILKQRPTDYPEIRMLLKQIVQEVNAIGHNINQITKNNNAGFYSLNDKKLLTIYLRKLIEEMKNMGEEVRKCGNT